jgi:hypothetical protein
MPRKRQPAALPSGDARRYRVVSGVPVPPPVNSLNVYPLARMKVGQSFRFPFNEQGRVRNAIARYRESAKSVRFTIRVEEKEERCRVWRIA